MPDDLTKDRSPEAYRRFRGLRLRPALGLLAKVAAPSHRPQRDAAWCCFPSAAFS
ncbi:MAG: hypothetical protein RIR62_1004 [Pseudomonadota bacterium]|jgi:trans-aconitate methyltransferase